MTQVEEIARKLCELDAVYKSPDEWVNQIPAWLLYENWAVEILKIVNKEKPRKAA